MKMDTTIKVGPKGGDLNNPQQSPAFRQKPMTTHTMLNGEMSLHRFEDTASNGTKNEQAWHRMAAYMILAGRTNSEIGLAAGVHPNTVAILKGNRWFQELLATIANNDGEEVIGTLKSEALESIAKLVDLRDGSESERVQLSAAITLLEHAHGKPIQKVVSLQHHSHLSPQEEMTEIQAELKRLRHRVVPVETEVVEVGET